MSVRREVSWPADAAAVVRAFSAEPSWCWLDDWSGRSILGVASELRLAERGREREFLAGLRGGDGTGSAAPQGWAVTLGYELGLALLGVDPAPDDAAPALALRLDTALVLDHARGIAELRGPDDAALDAWLAQYATALEPATYTQPVTSTQPVENAPFQPAERVLPAERLGASVRMGGSAGSGGAPDPWRTPAAAYEAEVEACRAAIRDGEAYVVCLTDTAEVEAAGVDPLALYLRVRDAAPGHPARGGVIVAGERALVSASPERFLSLEGGRIATHPIKGTRPRGATPEEDARLAAELAADPKERAENLMIVDLMRNDLSRVCEPGSVATTGFLRVETHPHVHQLVSTVEGRLREGADAIDAVEACFPGGSMTGAPKRRAVEILRELENGPRGLYAGCFGWLGAADTAGRIADAELAMTIRSAELRGLGTAGATAYVGAGGGVTIDSRAAREEAERRLKAAPMLAALEPRDH